MTRLQTLQGFYQNHVQPYYQKAHKNREENKPIAWVASTFPIEILQAMDITPIWPENYASVCAARQVSVQLAEVAERHGYSRDLCSYARTVIGSVLTEKTQDLPEGGMPKPNFLVASTAACDTHLKWFQILSHHLKRPLFLLDVPYNTTGADAENLEPQLIRQYVSQLEELAAFLEKQTNNPLDRNKLRKSITLSDRTSKLWLEIQDCRKNIPAPMGARDAFSAIFFMLSTPAAQDAVDFYEKLLDEVKGRARNGVGKIENERYRLIWDNLPMWFNLKFFNYLNNLGAIVVAETFSHVWTGSLDSSKPFESLARKYLPNFANCSIERRIDLILNLTKDFRANLIILPTNWGCRMMSIGEIIVKEAVYKKTEVPSLILDVDSSDSRNYDEYQVKTKLETYLKTLD
ncbi:MAG: 2-hydroxyacyl-CoA dehydratase [Candidatus Bathyarchaeota archaeon]|nr:MAG: 2-hydroxyacyl-CoA dehydratase [Candidatus Bathyarchaeota archaeon]